MAQRGRRRSRAPESRRRTSGLPIISEPNPRCVATRARRPRHAGQRREPLTRTPCSRRSATDVRPAARRAARRWISAVAAGVLIVAGSGCVARAGRRPDARGARRECGRREARGARREAARPRGGDAPTRFRPSPIVAAPRLRSTRRAARLLTRTSATTERAVSEPPVDDPSRTSRLRTVAARRRSATSHRATSHVAPANRRTVAPRRRAARTRLAPALAPRPRPSAPRPRPRASSRAPDEFQLGALLPALRRFRAGAAALPGRAAARRDERRGAQQSRPPLSRQGALRRGGARVPAGHRHRSDVRRPRTSTSRRRTTALGRFDAAAAEARERAAARSAQRRRAGQSLAGAASRRARPATRRAACAARSNSIRTTPPRTTIWRASSRTAGEASAAIDHYRQFLQYAGPEQAGVRRRRPRAVLRRSAARHQVDLMAEI